ncbi:lamin tail domain-containing protein [bacterium]|nr:lamin tail domain-containing protein [Verrucomicrobiota bacterium]MDA7667452.1 lamin tail domain-containing protein [bacterium]
MVLKFPHIGCRVLLVAILFIAATSHVIANESLVIINEILAGNSAGLRDEDGDASDWIELYNVGDSSVNLRGWSLTDDRRNQGKWVFPDVEIPVGEYLVLFASGKDRANPGKSLHTNFRLRASGGYIGMFDSGFPRKRVDEFTEGYPKQRHGIAYGVDRAGRLAFFRSPGPGRENVSKGIYRILSEPEFSVDRGFYTEAIKVELNGTDSNAVIRYTLDHSTPGPNLGMIYSEPLKISETSTLRAVAVAEGLLSSDVVTHTYLFTDSVTMGSLPVLSLSTDKKHLLGRYGIMESNPRNTDKHGKEWERSISAEWVFPDNPQKSIQTDCGIRVHGGMAIRERYEPFGRGTPGKYSFRLYFRGEYGSGSFRYPFFQNLPVDRFDSLVLRAGMNDSHNPFIADELVRRLHHDMRGVASQGMMVNLFLNGRYLGYYNPTERIDVGFLRSRLGGGSDWDLIAQFGEIQEGDEKEWNRLRKTVTEKDLSIPENYAEAVRQVDVESFIDYIILNVYVGMDDWPDNNWRAARERVPEAKWGFYIWDAERSFGNGLNHFHPNADPLYWDILNQGSLRGRSDIARLFQSLLKSPDFRLHFSDRVNHHFFSDGALTEDRIGMRHSILVEAVKSVIPDMKPFIGEEWIPKRKKIVIEQLKKMKLYRSDSAPQFKTLIDRVSSDFRLEMTSSIGEIFFTTDGSDPRFESGRVKSYKEPIPIGQTMRVRARTNDNGSWSALTESVFHPVEHRYPIRFTEIMYNPIGGSQYEFIELTNTSDVTMDLGWYRIKGISYQFKMRDSIGSREKIVLASDEHVASFRSRYPETDVQGYFSGSLSNKGERLTLIDRGGMSIMSVRYNDGEGWPTEADGGGYSLEMINPLNDPHDVENWRSGELQGGSPGR